MLRLIAVALSLVMVKDPQCWSFETEIGGPPPPPVMLLDDGSARFLRPFSTISMRWAISGDTLRVFTPQRWPWSVDIFVRGASRRSAPTEIVNGSDADVRRNRPLETRYRAQRIDCASMSWPENEQLVRIPDDPWGTERFDQPPRLENKEAVEKAVYEKWRTRRDLSKGESLAVRFLVDANGGAQGRPDGASSPIDVRILLMIEDLVSLAHFSPAVLAGQPVEGSVTVLFRFAPPGR